MTTEHIHNQVSIWIDDTLPKDTLADHVFYGKQELHRDIDRVINIINSHNCNNCQFNTSNTLCVQIVGRSPNHRQSNFACNLWQPIN